MRGDKELEKAAREGTLEVDLDVVRQQWVESGQVYDEISEAAELYGVYEDLFPGAHFRPATLLKRPRPRADRLCLKARRC